MTHMTTQMTFDLPLDHTWELTADRPISREEFVWFCHKNPELRCELTADGKIIVMAPLTFDSGLHEHEISSELRSFVKAQKKGIALGSSVGFTLPDGSVRAPDAAWISDEQLAGLSQAERQTFAHLVPAFVIEVRSKSDTMASLRRKMQESWIGNGVLLAWLIDPENRTSFVFFSGGRVEGPVPFTEVLTAEPVLPGFTLLLDELIKF